MFKAKSILIGLFSLLLFSPSAVHAQGGTIKESLTVQSRVLGKEVEYSVYLPANYESTNRHYPVLYLLHGFSDDETGWTQFGEIKTIMDKQTKKVAVTPMIIVMPDAGVSWYINNHDGSVKYKDFPRE